MSNKLNKDGRDCPDSGVQSGAHGYPDRTGQIRASGTKFCRSGPTLFLMESKYSALAPILIQIERSKPVDY